MYQIGFPRAKRQSGALLACERQGQDASRETTYGDVHSGEHDGVPGRHRKCKNETRSTLSGFHQVRQVAEINESTDLIPKSSAVICSRKLSVRPYYIAGTRLLRSLCTHCMESGATWLAWSCVVWLLVETLKNRSPFFSLSVADRARAEVSSEIACRHMANQDAELAGGNVTFYQRHNYVHFSKP